MHNPQQQQRNGVYLHSSQVKKFSSDEHREDSDIERSWELKEKLKIKGVSGNYSDGDNSVHEEDYANGNASDEYSSIDGNIFLFFFSHPFFLRSKK